MFVVCLVNMYMYTGTYFEVILSFTDLSGFHGYDPSACGLVYKLVRTSYVTSYEHEKM